MTQFVVGEPVTTEKPFVDVDAGMPVGLHRFRLEVFGASGQISAPSELVVQIVADTSAPLRLSRPATLTTASTASRKTRSKK